MHGRLGDADSRTVRGLATSSLSGEDAELATSVLLHNAHRADENLRLADLRKASELVARALADLLQE